jgi:hypothetical protein
MVLWILATASAALSMTEAAQAATSRCDSMCARRRTTANAPISVVISNTCTPSGRSRTRHCTAHRPRCARSRDSCCGGARTVSAAVASVVPVSVALAAVAAAVLNWTNIDRRDCRVAQWRHLRYRRPPPFPPPSSRTRPTLIRMATLTRRRHCTPRHRRRRRWRTRPLSQRTAAVRITTRQMRSMSMLKIMMMTHEATRRNRNLPPPRRIG